MVSRNWYYLARLISKQLKKGDAFGKLKPIAMINILDFELFDSEQYPEFFKTAALLLEGYEEDVCISEEVTFYFVELPKFGRTEKDYTNPLHIWLEYFQKGYGDADMRTELLKRNPDIVAFDEAYAKLQEDDETWTQYEFERRSREAYASGMQGAFEDGKIEGKIEIGEKLKRRGLPYDEIAECTGLSVAEIEKL